MSVGRKRTANHEGSKDAKEIEKEKEKEKALNHETHEDHEREMRSRSE
jgi:hypothetical protein